MDDIQTRFLQYQSAIEESNIVSKTDVNGIITFVNDEFCKISGYSKNELIGRNHNVVRHPDIPKHLFKDLWDTILSKKVYKTIAKNKNKDGSVVYLNTTIIPILNSFGEIEEFVAIRHDVTKLVSLQNELRELNENLEAKVAKKTAQLAEINEHLKELVAKEVAKNEENTKMLLIQSRLASMGEMLASISHQWRQPLNELSIMLYKLKRSVGNTDKGFEFLYNDIKKVISNMSHTIDDFRNFFANDQHLQEFWLSELFSNLNLMMGLSLKKHNINLNVNIKTDTLVCSYKSWLNQVLINIVKNAKDALLQSGVENMFIDINLYQEGSYAIISICDNAGGIDESIKDRIFEPFFTTKQANNGTGLGLYMSRLILERLNGYIKVSSSDVGACFVIALPIRGAEYE